jgi:hypothetical protein
MRPIYLSFALCAFAFSGTQVSAQVSAPSVDCSDLKPEKLPCTHSCTASEKKHLGEFKCVFQKKDDKCETEYRSSLEGIYDACRPPVKK